MTSQVPPSYADTAPAVEYAPSPQQMHHSDGPPPFTNTNDEPAKPEYSKEGDAVPAVEAAEDNKPKTLLQRVRRPKDNGCCCCLLILFFIGFIVASFAAVSFGIAVGVEKGLTGEYMWSPGHNKLFRICESSSLTGNTLAVHTCNVYRLLQDINAPPVRSFTENIRTWQSFNSNSRAMPGSAARINAVRLESLLFEEGLRCTSSSPPGTVRRDGAAQIIIGQVGQSFGMRKTAKACNFDEYGRNIQDYCAEYGDGGQKAFAKPHPLSINEIFGKHFGMNCSWVEGVY